MKKAKILWVGLILILAGISECKAMGLGDWNFQTKAKTNLHNGYQSISIEKRNVQIHLAKQWYFYKNHIIGIRQKSYQDKKSTIYFIFNEKSTQLEEFNEIEKWRKVITQKKLNPMVFTRWFQHHGSIILLPLILFSIAFWFLSIPLYLLLLWRLFYFLKRIAFIEKFSPQEPATRIFIFMIFVSWIVYFFNTNPNSF